MFVFTHDSVGVGEDGPTHQPVEQLAIAAVDSRAAGDPPGRCQRNVRGLARGGRARRSDGPRPVAPEPSGVHRRHGSRARRRRRPRRQRARRSCLSAPAAKCMSAWPPPSARRRGRAARAWFASRRGIGSLAHPTATRAVVLPAGRARAVGRGSHAPSVGRVYADDSIGIDRFGASAPGAVALDKLGINVEQRRRAGTGARLAGRLAADTVSIEPQEEPPWTDSSVSSRTSGRARGSTT